ESSVREVVRRTRGHTQGPITRLMSPGDLGRIAKPFVFLDLAEFDGRFAPTPMDYLWHPHSGIATVTVMLEGGIRFAETTGRDGQGFCRGGALSGWGEGGGSGRPGNLCQDGPGSFSSGSPSRPSSRMLRTRARISCRRTFQRKVPHRSFSDSTGRQRVLSWL